MRMFQVEGVKRKKKSPKKKTKKKTYLTTRGRCFLVILTNVLSGILWLHLSECSRITLFNFGSLWRWKGWTKMNAVKCSASQFLLLYVKSVPHRRGFFLPLQVWVFVFEADVYVRVWWAPTICHLCVFLSFSLCCHSCPSLFCFSFISTLHCQHCPPLFLLASLLCFLAPHSFSSSSPSCSSSSLLPPLLIPFSAPHPTTTITPALVLASKVPWEACGLSAGRHTNTTAATTGTSLFSLSFLPLPCSLCFPSSPSSLSLFFPSSLFNVEVLSNCWLPLWLGGNGIFRRMPHAVASIHSWAPHPHPHPITHRHRHTHQQHWHRWIQAAYSSTHMHKSGL